MEKEPQPSAGFEEPQPANPRRTATLIAIAGAVIIMVAFFSGSRYDSQTTRHRPDLRLHPQLQIHVGSQFDLTTMVFGLMVGLLMLPGSRPR